MKICLIFLLLAANMILLIILLAVIGSSRNENTGGISILMVSSAAYSLTYNLPFEDLVMNDTFEALALNLPIRAYFNLFSAFLALIAILFLDLRLFRILRFTE